MKNLTRMLTIMAVVVLAYGCKSSDSGNDKDLVIYSQTGDVTLKTSTDEAVSISYSFKKGKVISNRIESIMELEMMGQKIPMSYMSEGSYEITEVKEDGSAVVAYKISRMHIKAEQQGIDYDTQNKEVDPNHKMLDEMFRKMLNVPISFVITNKGKIQSVDYAAMTEAFGPQYMFIKQQIEQNANNFSQNSFVTLPEGELKAGDIIEGELIEQNIQGIEIKAKTDYKVKMISSNKKKILLETIGKLDFNAMNLPEGTSITMNEGNVTGWVLLDVDAGYITQSKIDTYMDFTSEENGEKTNLILRTTTNMKVN